MATSEIAERTNYSPYINLINVMKYTAQLFSITKTQGENKQIMGKLNKQKALEHKYAVTE